MEHTADMKFQAFGKDFEEALMNSVEATFFGLCGEANIASKTQKEIKIQAKTKQNLVYDFIDEFLFIMDTESLVLSKIERPKVERNDDEFVVSCIAFFDDAKNYDISGNVKSVTYSEMLIEEKENDVMIQIVLDI